MDQINPQNLGEIFQLLAQQQAQFQAQLQEQMNANSARFEALSTKPPAARKAAPPTYHGTLEEDLELWIFAVEQYYSEYYPQMQEDSPAFVTMVSCHLGVTPMNWYRQFSQECQHASLPKSWPRFTAALRKRFLPPDHEYSLRERLCATTQTGSIHEYMAEFQNILVQCQLPISPMEVRFYFQQGLRPSVAAHLSEHQPSSFEECCAIASRYDHAPTATTTKNADWIKTAVCHRCKTVGHLAPNCPHK